MGENQSELFEEIPPAVKPSGELPTFCQGEKVIEVPYSIWKGGRIRADLSAYGAGEIVSRNKANLQERVLQALRDSFGATVEAVYKEFSRVGRQAPVRPRISNKRAANNARGEQPRLRINPFKKDVWNFSKAPQWLLVRKEPSLAEKLVYTRLTYAPPEKEEEKICKKDVALGAILELSQSKLAKELGITRECVCGALKSLQGRGLIEYFGKQGARGSIYFLLHPWMPSTCELQSQVEAAAGVKSDHSACEFASQVPVGLPHNSCDQNQQVSLGPKKREKQREERKTSSLGWGQS